ncbi:MAG: toll/interleukin-1 receptor domain-containing protein [Ginsengibacter sp.]
MDETPKPNASIFISYAHLDEELKKELDKYLKVLKRSSKIESWNDRDLVPGQEWDAEIMAALAKANVILLLISIDFNASDFIWDKELASAMKRHEEGTAHVVPVILRRCDWSKMPYAKLQALPRNATPITEYENRDEGFTEVAIGIEKLVDYMNSKQTA